MFVDATTDIHMPERNINRSTETIHRKRFHVTTYRNAGKRKRRRVNRIKKINTKKS